MVSKAMLGFGLAAIVFLTLGLVSLAMFDDPLAPDSAPKPHAPPRVISVRVLGTVAEITGVPESKNLATQKDGIITIEEPAIVTIRLAEDRTVKVWSKLTFIDTKHGIVRNVTFSPLSEAVTFGKAKAELVRLMGEMKIEPNENWRRHAATWPDEDQQHRYLNHFSLSESIIFEAELRPAPDIQYYYLSLEFAAWGNADRALWDPSFKAKAKSTGGTSGADKKKENK